MYVFFFHLGMLFQKYKSIPNVVKFLYLLGSFFDYMRSFRTYSWIWALLAVTKFVKVQFSWPTSYSAFHSKMTLIEALWRQMKNSCKFSRKSVEPFFCLVYLKLRECRQMLRVTQKKFLWSSNVGKRI